MLSFTAFRISLSPLTSPTHPISLPSAPFSLWIYPPCLSWLWTRDGPSRSCLNPLHHLAHSVNIIALTQIMLTLPSFFFELSNDTLLRWCFSFSLASASSCCVAEVDFVCCEPPSCRVGITGLDRGETKEDAVRGETTLRRGENVESAEPVESPSDAAPI